MSVFFPRQSGLGSCRSEHPRHESPPLARRVARWSALLAGVAMLSACGGGDNSATTTSVTSINSVAAVLRPGVTTSVIVRGTGLDSASVSLSGCSASQELSRSSFAVVFQCTVGSADDVIAVVNGREAAKRLAVPRVDRIELLTTGPLKFGALTAFRVTGHGLTENLTPVSDACNEILVSKATSDVLEFDCFVSATTGNVGVQAADETPFDATLVISAPNPPRVTLTMADNSTTPATTRTLTIELDSTNAPISTYNFLRYANAEFYNGTIFHRVENSPLQVMQGGYFVGKTAAALTESASLKEFLDNSSTIPLESTQTTGLSNIAGSIAMARGQDPDSAQAQFYFNVGDNSGQLDYVNDNSPGYAVFGRVVGSNDQATLTTLGGTTTQTLSGGTTNVPEKDIVITSVVQTQ